MYYHVSQELVQTIRGLQSTAFPGVETERFFNRSPWQSEAHLEGFWDEAVEDLADSDIDLFA